MRAHETDREEERLAGVLFDQVDGLGRRPAIGVGEVIALGLNHDEGVSTHDRFLTVGISLERFAGARRLPFRAEAVEPLRPRQRIVGAVSAVVDAGIKTFLHSARHPHMIDLADARGVVPRILEMLRPGCAVTDRLTRTGVAQHARRVRVIARHEGGAGGPAVGGLAIRAGEAGALRRQAIDVGRVAHRVPVARERGRGQVVGNDEQHIRGGFRARRGCGDGGWDAGESGEGEKQG